ncbi:hypothetical protein ALI22I_20455 [Saccharothrix sp. ALI-22-I]|uniref:DUF4192 domain-containing protein n=1 Tax=Saccharothrix sp. ALI-22-I TaxID=1933778 RepID=UPI00097C88F1|nr:DUF4192 domain-containing protein [Saccharothrix sp. ALI-22-I]ONI88113.1 hypothetical protein ALI22I_20455 [Saccharothrix sp. ALI-22-I]
MLDEPWTNHLPVTDQALTDPTLFLSTLPYQIGFLPTAGQAVLTCRRAGVFAETKVVNLDHDTEKVLTEYAQRFHRDNADPAIALTVVAEDHHGPTSAADVLDRLVAALRRVGTDPVAACRVASITEGAVWTSAAGRTGVLVDPRDTPAGMAADIHGYTFHADAQALEAIVAPDPDEVVRRRADALGQLHWAEGLTLVAADSGGPSPSRRRYDLAMKHLMAAIDPTPPLCEGEIVDLAAALADWRVRDKLMGHVHDRDLRNAGARLFGELTRACPTPVVADVACLLAWYSLWRGDRALTLRALARAEDAVPNHLLTELLSEAARSDSGLKRFDHIVGIARDVDLDRWPVVVGLPHYDR